MDQPPEGTPGDSYLPKSAYSVSRVAADPKTKGLETPLENAHALLKKALRDLEDLREVEQRKTALVDVGDGNCDDDVESFELGLFAVVKKQRGDQRYSRYFKDGLREVTTAEARQEEPALVGQMLVAMNEDKADPELAPLIAVSMPKLTASRAAILAADKDLATTEEEIAFLKDKTLPALMAAWRDEYKKLEAALTTVYPANAKAVDRCFKPFRKHRKAKKTPAVPELAVPAPAAPTVPATSTVAVEPAKA